MLKRKLVNRKNLRCTLSTWQALSAVWGSQITAPYSIIGWTNEQYRTFNDEVRLRSFDNLIIIPSILRALQEAISM
ncbi:Uncharacterized protein FWK35_00028848 [Aphis craccivora]|uniref:Uncharacterized protein n=1 Tax=Aphis craccivora TaxID=307492 RepID=A0A6G0YNA8_APHCR|nr:Uncharacterized protein FWK35_00028848 [Aphis craccivora]